MRARLPFSNRRRLVAGAAVLGLLAVYALGGRGDAGLSPERALARAEARAADAGTFRVELRSTPGTGAWELHGSGAVDYARGRGRVDLQTEMPGPFTDPRVTYLYDRREAYVSSGWLAAGISGAKPWLGLGGDESWSPLDDLLPFADPARALAFLRSADTIVEAPEAESVRGVPTTRYSARVDLARAAEQATGAQRERLESEVDARRFEERSTVIGVDVWIGGDGLARRIRATDDEPAGETVTIEYFDFGSEFVFQAPPADQVMTFEELRELLPESHCDTSETDEGRATVCIQVVQFGSDETD